MPKRSSIVASSKQAERDVAILFKGRRLHAGEWEGRPGDVDVLAGRYIIQVKHRKGVPVYILEGLQQIQEAAAAYADHDETKIPLLVIKTKPGGGKPSRTFVVIEAEDWMTHIDSALETLDQPLFMEEYPDNV